MNTSTQIKNNTVNDLADLLVKLGKHKYEANAEACRMGLPYCWAYGTLTALFDQARYMQGVTVQELVDRKIAEVEKELAAA
jgi:hypothetical protein